MYNLILQQFIYYIFIVYVMNIQHISEFNTIGIILNSNSTFIALNLSQKTDSKAHHTKTLFNIQKPETLLGSAPRRKQKEIGNLRWVCFSKEV